VKLNQRIRISWRRRLLTPATVVLQRFCSVSVPSWITAERERRADGAFGELFKEGLIYEQSAARTLLGLRPNLCWA
jgi:hypothetical protein